jgi:uncharacterized paraquat-inducible protein A
MMEKFRQFMYGRYGNDLLNFALMIVGCVITAVLSFVDVPYIHYLGLIPYLAVIYRTLSKNIPARQRENAKFIELIQPWKRFIIKKVRQLQDKSHRYYACPQCHNTLRVPKGRGKIKISCPHCGKEFIRKT